MYVQLQHVTLSCSLYILDTQKDACFVSTVDFYTCGQMTLMPCEKLMDEWMSDK